MILIHPTQYKGNLHSHSTFSDGHLSPQELKKAYRSHGYSILAVTDHERPQDHSALSEDDFLMLTGYEAYIRPSKEAKYDVYAPEIHLNLFARDPHNIDLINWNDRYVKYEKNPVAKAQMPRYGSTLPREYTVDYLNSFIQTAREDGYLVALNHPVWSMEDYNFLFGLKGWFSMEICNYGSYRSGIPEYNGALYDMLLRRGFRVFAHGSDDNHNPGPLDVPASDSFGAFTLFNTPDDRLDYDAVITALEQGSFYASMGPRIHSLEIAGKKAILTCSEAERITMLFGAKTTKSVYAPSFDASVTEAVFDLPDHAPYIRFSVMDHFGRYADTRGYFRDEWKEIR